MLKFLTTSKFAMPIVRHGITTLGGFLMSEGYVDEASWQSISGGLIAFAGLGMSWFDKRHRVP